MGEVMTAIHHHRRAHVALDRARDYLDLRARVIDPTSAFQTTHHEWIERYCLFMASIALHVAFRNQPALRRADPPVTLRWE
jgi:hypothetical protein